MAERFDVKCLGGVSMFIAYVIDICRLVMEVLIVNITHKKMSVSLTLKASHALLDTQLFLAISGTFGFRIDRLKTLFHVKII